MKRWIVRVALVANIYPIAFSAVAPAHAQSAAAQELFDAAKKLTKEGKHAEACPKFEESQRLDPAPGTKFFLADCWEHIDRTASAWAAYIELADESAASGQKDREKVARERADLLAGKLTRLSVIVPAASRILGLVVTRDGVVLKEAQWGIGVPVDPGEHLLEATAPDSEPWQKKSDVRGEGKTTTVEVPKLPRAKPSGTASRPANQPAGDQRMDKGTDASTGRGQRTIGIVVGAVGLVGIGVGGYFGLQSFSKHDEYQGHCKDNVCDDTGVALHDDAVKAGNISTIAMGAGLALVTTGVTLFLTAPKAKSTALGLAPAVGPSAGAVSLKGTW